MDGDKSGESGVFLFSRDASQISAMVGDHSRQIKTQICTVGDVGALAMDFAHYQSPINCWAPVPLSRKFQFLAHFPFPAKFIGRIWVWLVAIIRYIWDGQRKVKSPIVLDFPDIWKPGFISRPSLILNNKKLNTVICVLILVGSIKFLDLTFHRESWCRSLFFNKL